MDQIQTHPEWYNDGVEDGKDMWTIDVDAEVTIQIFCQVTGEPEEFHYTESFRLFIERDQRDASGNTRIFYACKSFDITPEAAKDLLLGDSARTARRLAQEISEVRKLPNQQKYCK